MATPLIACIVVLLSCGGGAKDPTGLLSGNWQMVLQQNPPSAVTQTESGFLVQTGETLTGGVVLADQTECPGLGSVQGTISGSTVAITVNQVGETVNLTGTAASDGSAMAGTYSILASGCSGGSSIGTWTATPVKPVTGTYLATFTSYTLGSYSYAVTVTQGPNTGASIATLSGTMSSSDAPCGSNLSISGVVSGTSVVFGFLTADGTAVGKFTGTAIPNATTLTGPYDFVAQSGGCAGDSGTASVIQQSSPT